LINNNNNIDNCALTSHKKTQQQTKETKERERGGERESHRPTGCGKGISRVRKTP
jgi:hypothetical protein